MTGGLEGCGLHFQMLLSWLLYDTDAVRLHPLHLVSVSPVLCNHFCVATTHAPKAHLLPLTDISVFVFLSLSLTTEESRQSAVMDEGEWTGRREGGGGLRRLEEKGTMRASSSSVSTKRHTPPANNRSVPACAMGGVL